ncbi:MAG: DUF4369 domain-containing protein [Bacteroidales bacterium]|nr:DUF4369 domain-containing protein [Bacteroidales bacterium]MCF8336850.1 DUF4369 domain-containing protein [Bacteroidales bacterium]
MKHVILFIAILALILASCNNHDGYKIQGHIAGIDSAKVYLGTKDYTRQYSVNPIDSATLVDKKFVFEGSVDVPALRYIKVTRQFGDIPVFVENSRIKVRSSEKKYPEATISGSDMHKHYEQFLSKAKAHESKMDSLRRLSQLAKDRLEPEEKLEKLSNQRRQVSRKAGEFYQDYILSEAPSPVRLQAFQRINSNSFLSRKLLDSLYHSLDSSVYTTKHVKQLKKRIEYLAKVEPGQPYINLTQKDIEGNKVALSDYVGENEYVLLYFVWRCPHTGIIPRGFKDLYKKYHDKGVEFYGVYTDTARFLWKNSIKKHDISWPFVSNLNGSQSEVYEKYSRYNTPYRFLIDKEGKFAGKFLKTQEIEEKLEEVL